MESISTTTHEEKIIIYQVMTRLFGNKNSTNKICGSLSENGSGKFNDIDETALKAIKDLGINHVWYTGIIEHATMNDNTAYGIKLDDPDVVKGKAGSPYAIKDYFDVCPELAVDVKNRMTEFTDLVKRTHDHGMKVIIDFVPNHVARKYESDARPAGIPDLGENDDTSVSFSPNNNFYYLPGQSIVIPKLDNTLCNNVPSIPPDARLREVPAKVTGNNVFSAHPSVYDWFETIKLNYGVDVQNHGHTYFDPIPATWTRMLEILLYWSEKGVDGFRCDMAELVPVEFWAWVIPKVKAKFPAVTFIAEIYKTDQYHSYIFQGKFDYIYDKVGLYDSLRKLMEGHGTVEEITHCWQGSANGLGHYMLRFLENHDEQRVASRYFAKDPWTAVAAMVVSATLSTGPLMIYFGQEVGEPAIGASGFSGDDGRTTIFDFWSVPEHQKWMNDGKFDGALLSDDQKNLLQFYKTLLNVSLNSEAISTGDFYGLQYVNDHYQSENYNHSRVYSYLRFSKNETLLIVNNFSREELKTVVKIPKGAWEFIGLNPEAKYKAKDLLSADKAFSFEAINTYQQNQQSGVPVSLKPMGARIYRITKA